MLQLQFNTSYCNIDLFTIVLCGHHCGLWENRETAEEITSQVRCHSSWCQRTDGPQYTVIPECWKHPGRQKIHFMTELCQNSRLWSSGVLCLPD